MFRLTNHVDNMCLDGPSEDQPALCPGKPPSTPVKLLPAISLPPLTPPNRYSPKSPFLCSDSSGSIENPMENYPDDVSGTNEELYSPVGNPMRPMSPMSPLNPMNPMNAWGYSSGKEKSSGTPKTRCSEPHLLSPFHEKEKSPDAQRTIYPELQSFTTENAIKTSEEADEKLLCAWQGTSTYEDPDWITECSKTLLDQLIARRDAAEADIQKGPYDPENWLKLTQVYFELRFSDLQVASAHKALFLIGLGLDLKDHLIGQKVRDAVGIRLFCRCEVVIADDLEHARLESFKAQLRGFINLGAYWDGLKEAKYALEICSGDGGLHFLQDMLKEKFKRRATGLQMTSIPAEDLKYLGRIGKTHKRQYPWLEEKFFARSQDFLNDINMEFNSTNCEVRPFPRRSERLAIKSPKQHFKSYTPVTKSNVGPLGVFAKRNIYKDEIILTDHNLTMVPSTPPKKLLHCDACHALLAPPFFKDKIVGPKCCKGVAFCSKECLDAAVTGYHKVLCGKDFRWVYSSPQSKELDPSWIPSAFLRILAIVVADLKAKPGMHPLEHPLLARLTAGYASSALHDIEHGWNYFSHIIAPTRILAQLGVDVIADQKWSAEVIHTIYWRVMTNACCANSVTVKDGKLEQTVISGIAPSYMMFNHSCDASIGWMAAGGFEGMARASSDSSSLGKRRRGNEKSEMKEVKVGCNALLCVALRDIKKGEEARIAYLPPGNEERLGRWFDGGQCLCGACEEEEDDDFDWDACEWTE